MKKIKHSKVKNTGLIFELLVRQVAVDTMNGTKTASLDILNKFFRKSTELTKELKLYRSLHEETFNTNEKALQFIDAVIKARKQLNESSLKREKYNLIKEIKSKFDLDSFFKSRVTNYKLQASIYNLFEFAEADDPSVYVRNKFVLAEHVQSNKKVHQVKTKLVNEHQDVRILASKLLIDKFNQKYDALTVGQKHILREYINNVTNSEKLKAYVVKESISISKELTSLKTAIPSKVVRIKINEVIRLLSKLRKKHIIEDKDVLTMLRYHELINELKNVRSN